MPVSTDSDAWKEAEQEVSLHQKILDFLKSEPNQAFHYRELSDEVSITDWEKAHERERKRQEVGEDEFAERVVEGEFPELESPAGDAITEGDATSRVLSAAEELVFSGLLQSRQVAVEETDIPYEDWETVLFYRFVEEE